jgi:hypothetical protein
MNTRRNDVSELKPHCSAILATGKPFKSNALASSIRRLLI